MARSVWHRGSLQVDQLRTADMPAYVKVVKNGEVHWILVVSAPAPEDSRPA